MTEDLSQIPTKTLLAKLRSCRVYQSQIRTSAEFQIALLDEKATKMKTELATREHIPNKPERKRLRQDAARLGRTSEKQRR